MRRLCLPSSPLTASRPPLRAAPRAALAAAGLACCLGAWAQEADPAAPNLDPAAFQACLARLGGQAEDKGVARTTFDTQLRDVQPDASILPLLDAQPEFKTPLWDYLAGLVDDERVRDGQRMLAQWQDVLARAQQRFGVDPATVVAVWGVESNFGQNFGGRPLLTSLSTLSCFGRRQAFFQGELFATLKILQDEHVPADRLVGSWAGAFGHTQFMPSTYLRLAVDFDGDGRRDLVDSVPDALASTANFLDKAGWQPGLAWGYEVKLPRGFDTGVAGRRNKQPMSRWTALGVLRVDGSTLPAGNAPAALLLPAGPRGPAFIVTRNFDALYSYNAAESYGLAIAHLSDRLRGGGPFVTPWPTDDPGLSRAERRELQALLLIHGHDIGNPDGVIGARSRQAIEAEQERLGLPVDGHAGQKILKALRRS
ncbi:MAG: lytic murein transglycosylase [Comamonas sp.]